MILSKFFDDAGLFPPASLSMADAVARHRADLAGPYGHLLASFVVPALRLGELGDQLTADDRWGVSLLLVGGEMPDDIALPPNLRLAQSEIRVGGGVDAALIAATRVSAFIPAYVEIPAGDVEAIAVLAGRHRDGVQAGAKIRCGGTSEKLFPSVESLAATIAACARLNVPWKATAGLHQPVRYQDRSDGFTHHGFLNLLAATAIALSDPADPAIIDALADEGRSAFQVSGDGFRWRDRDVKPSECLAVRELFTGVGTCSFDEPVTELNRMGITLR